MDSEIASSGKLKFKWLYLAWIGVVFSSVVIGIISAIVQGPPEPVVSKWGISNFSIFAIALYSLGSVVAVVVLYYLLKGQGLNLTAIGFTGKLSLNGTLFVVLGLIVAFILYPAIESILKPIGIPMFWRGGASSALHLRTTVDIILILIFAVLVGPVAEETIFRGYVLNTFLLRSNNILSAYIWSALVFASAHVFVGPGTIIFIFFWSFIPAFLLLKFGNLYWPFCFHILNNFVTYVVFPLWLL